MHNFQTRINFSETDAAGIMFFGNAFSLIHRAYEDLIFNQFPQINYFMHDLYAFPIVHSEADFFSPLRFGDNVEIELCVTELKKYKFVIEYKVFDQKRSLAFKASTIHLCVRKDNFSKIDLPEDLFNLLAENLQKS